MSSERDVIDAIEQMIALRHEPELLEYTPKMRQDRRDVVEKKLAEALRAYIDERVEARLHKLFAATPGTLNDKPETA